MITITKNSKANFDLHLRDEDGNPISLSDYASGVLKFRNCDGDVTEIELDIPGDNPDAGKIPVSLTSEDTADADDKWASADLVLTDSDEEEEIIPLNNEFEILVPNTGDES